MSGEIIINLTVNSNTTITNLTLTGGGTPYIDWGDGNTSAYTNNITHTYEESGNYILTISGATSIGANFLQNQTSVTSITIQEIVTNIGDNFLSGCTNCKKVTFLRPSPPTLGTNPFTGMTGYLLYVNEASINSYKSATNYPTQASYYKSVSSFEQRLRTLGDKLRTNLQTKGVQTSPNAGLTTLAESINLIGAETDYWGSTGIFHEDNWDDGESYYKPIITKDRKIICKVGYSGFTIPLPEEDEYTICFVVTFTGADEQVDLGGFSPTLMECPIPFELPMLISKKSENDIIEIWSAVSGDCWQVTAPSNVTFTAIPVNAIILSEFHYTDTYFDPMEDTMPYTHMTYEVCWDDGQVVSEGDTPTLRPNNYRIYITDEEQTVFSTVISSSTDYNYFIDDYGGTGGNNTVDYWGYVHFFMPEQGKNYTWKTNDELTQNLTVWTSHSYGSGANRKDTYYNYPHYDSFIGSPTIDLHIGTEWEIEFTYNKINNTTNEGIIIIHNDIYDINLGVYNNKAGLWSTEGDALTESTFPSGNSIRFKILSPTITLQSGNTYAISYEYWINNTRRTYNSTYTLMSGETVDGLKNMILKSISQTVDGTVTDLKVKLKDKKDTTLLARHLAYNQSMFQMSGLLQDEDGDYLSDKSVTVDIIQNSNNTILSTTTVTTGDCGVISETYAGASGGGEYANGNLSVKFTFDGDTGYNPTTRTITVNDEDEFQYAIAVPQGSFTNGVLTITGIQVQTLPNIIDTYRITEDWSVDVYDENNNYLTTLTDQNNTYSTQLTTVQTKAELSCPISCRMKTWSESS